MILQGTLTDCTNGSALAARTTIGYKPNARRYASQLVVVFGCGYKSLVRII
jgi:hypothetical protein